MGNEMMISTAENAVTIYVGDRVNEAVRMLVQAVYNHLKANPIPGMIECVPAMASVTVYYHPTVRRTSAQVKMELEKRLKELELQGTNDYTQAGNCQRIVDIPVCYGGEYGPDLVKVAEWNRMSVNEVVDIHASGRYPVHMLGFAPGFPYLGGMSPRIAAPRKQQPRVRVPAGSVGIAGEQTGIYSIAMPGGWQLIGRTPLRLFTPEVSPPSLLSPGDIVRFISISDEEYQRLEGLNTESSG